MNGRLIVFAKAVDDKELGVYIEGVYFGGITDTEKEAEAIARDCVNNTRGGAAIPKIVDLADYDSITAAFTDLKSRFSKLENEMFQTEFIQEQNRLSGKKKR